MELPLYQVGPDSPRNPLGGREAEGFGKWVTATYLQMRDAADQMYRPQDDSVPARLARDSAQHYRQVYHLWARVEHGAPGGAWEFARDTLEVQLITDVMSGHYWACYAQEKFRAGISPEPGRKAWVQMSADYLRACLIFAAYTGVKQTDVTDCDGDQFRLSALRA